MDEQKKAQIMQIMQDHVKVFGWPNIPDADEVIMSQLQPMFKKLLLLNLVKYQDWDAFCLAAETQYTLAKMRE
jgi:hypothetical protein